MRRSSHFSLICIVARQQSGTVSFCGSCHLRQKRACSAHTCFASQTRQPAQQTNNPSSPNSPPPKKTEHPLFPCSTYLVVDSEEEWYPEEVAAVDRGVQEHGLQLVVFAEWWVHLFLGRGAGGGKEWGCRGPGF